MIEPCEEPKKAPDFPDWAKWIARDADGPLWGYENKPERDRFSRTWEVEMGKAERLPSSTFTLAEIDWKHEPLSIWVYTPVVNADEPDDPKISKHAEIARQLNDIYKAKNHDYGDAFGQTFRELGIISAVTRITDKTNRLKKLCTSESQVKDESIKDTLMDLANYAIMTLIELEEGTE